MNTLSTLQEFYKNQSVLLTGATGFLGKILVQKLLRSCKDVSQIYILIRPKKGKSVGERLNEMLNNPVFDSMKKEVPDYSKKIVAIPGDCTLPNLGLTIDSRNILADKISVVFNAAASVKLNEKLTLSAASNFRSINEMIKLCSNMQNLKAYINVSTAYTNVAFTENIEEKFYDYPIKSEEYLKLINSQPEDQLNKNGQKIIKPWPNTYTFNKSMGEDLIRTNHRNMPIGIFRPGIVISVAEDPVPGWVDNYFAPNGMAANTAKGILRTSHVDPSCIANFTPVDYIVNSIIASAWDVATQIDRRGENMLIYNFSSTKDATITWGMFQDYINKYIPKYALTTSYGEPKLKCNKSKYAYSFEALYLHWMRAIFYDALAIASGREERLLKVYPRINRFIRDLSYFLTREWDFEDRNVNNLWNRLSPKDQQMFKFTMQNFDWDAYFVNYVKGIRDLIESKNK